jgi:cytoskeletal protein RodZ
MERFSTNTGTFVHEAAFPALNAPAKFTVISLICCGAYAKVITMAATLKQRREELGHTIESVAQATKIKSSYLRAIEEADFGKLPINVYTKGYMRQYAQFLGLRPEGIVEAYEAYLTASKARPEDVPLRRERPAEEQSKVVHRSASLHLSKRALLVVTILIALMGVYLALPHRREVPRPAEPPKREVPVPAVVTDQPPATPPQEVLVPDTPEPRQTARHALQIVATDVVWLQVIIDGGEKREMILQPGEKVKYEAHDSLVLKVGNAGGVLLKYNEKDLEHLGNKGEVVRLSFPETGILQNPQAPTGSVGGRIVPPSEASHRDSHLPPQP